MEGRKKQKGQRQRDGRPDGGQANNKKDSRTGKQREAEGVLENLFQNSADSIGITSLPKEKSQNPSIPITSLLTKWDTVSLAHVPALFLWLVTPQR